MRIMKKLPGLALAVVLLMSSAVLTQGAPPKSTNPSAAKEKARLEGVFKQLDQNKNGQLTRDEFMDFWKRNFDARDKNDDGLHDQTEILLASQIEAFDLNKDGVVSLEEELSVRDRHWKHFDIGGKGVVNWADFFARSPERSANPNAHNNATTFTKMDADSDGYLTSEEYLAFWNGYFNGRDADQNRALDAGEYGHPESFSAFDADGDGKINIEEHALIREQDFKELDKDDDGLLTQAEFVR